MAYLQRGEVDNTINVGMLDEHFVQLRLIGDITLIVLRAFATDQLDAVDDLCGGVVQVVDDDDFVVCLEQGKCGEGANVAGAAIEVSIRLEMGCVPVVGNIVSIWGQCQWSRESSRSPNLPGDQDRTNDHGECLSGFVTLVWNLEVATGLLYVYRVAAPTCRCANSKRNLVSRVLP